MAAVEYTDEQMEDIKEAFEVFSSTPDLQVTYPDVGGLLRALDCNPTNEEIQTALGTPSKEDMAAKAMKLEEFLVIYGKIMKDSVVGTYDDLVEGLRVFDKEGNNTVMGAEIRHVLRTLGEKLTIPEINSVMDGSEDMNGIIQIDDFCKYLLGEKTE